MKNKIVTAILALFFGLFGVHRFYLGQKVWGVLLFMASMLGILLMEAPAQPFPFIILPVLIGFIDAVLFFAMPQAEFDNKYNQSTPPIEERKTTHSADYYRKKGIEYYRYEAYEDAIEAFEQAIAYGDQRPTIYFNLACCHALLQSPREAFRHLETAFRLGFEDQSKLYSHPALATLRSHPDFEQWLEIIRQPQTNNLLEVLAPKNVQPLKEQFDLLEDLKARDILTHEEYEMQKKRLLESL